LIKQKEKLTKDLITYGYLTAKNPYNFGYRFTFINNSWRRSDPKKPKKSQDQIVIADLPLRFFHKATEVKYFENTQGFIWEEICRSIFGSFLQLRKRLGLSDKAIVHEGYFCEPFTEIDIVISDKDNEHILWGSCKRNSEKQNLISLLSHLLSFFNNRGFGNHKWFTYKHTLLFMSPSFQTGKKEQISVDWVGTANSLLMPAKRKHLVDLAATLLSDHANRPRKGSKKVLPPFELSQGAPDALFAVHETIALDFNDFL